MHGVGPTVMGPYNCIACFYIKDCTGKGQNLKLARVHCENFHAKTNTLQLKVTLSFHSTSYSPTCAILHMRSVQESLKVIVYRNGTYSVIRSIEDHQRLYSRRNKGMAGR